MVDISIGAGGSCCGYDFVRVAGEGLEKHEPEVSTRGPCHCALLACAAVRCRGKARTTSELQNMTSHSSADTALLFG